MSEHERVQEILPEVVLDALDDLERRRALAHVQMCAPCAQELEILSETAAALAHLEIVTDDETRLHRTRARLLVRAELDRAAIAPAPAAAPPRALPRFSLSQTSGWMVAATLAGLLLTHHTFHQPLSFGWLVASALAAALVGTLWYLHVLRARLRQLESRASRPTHPDASPPTR